MDESGPESPSHEPISEDVDRAEMATEPTPAKEPDGAYLTVVDPRTLATLLPLDMVGGLIEWGLPALGVLNGARILLTVSQDRAAGLAAWFDSFLGCSYVIGVHTLAGLGLGALLRVVGRWVESCAKVGQEPWRLAALGDRIEALLSRPIEDRAAGGQSSPPVRALDLLKEQSLADFRRSIRAADWKEAGALLDAFSQDYADDPRVPSMHEELQSARESALKEHTAQLDAARSVNDPERVLELHQAMVPLLEAEARSSLEAELSRWFLKLIHNRLRTGKIQTDVAVLAGRIAEIFSHTVEGASLRASLPTLRRSAGLCPRCAQPYTGIADACPSCLGLANQPAKPPPSLSS
jgi:hypothetical protein